MLKVLNGAKTGNLIFAALVFFCLAGLGGQELPVVPRIVFTTATEEGGALTADAIPPGALAAVEDNGVLDPNAQFMVSKNARAIRRIVKQDVYGRVLTDDFYFYRNALNSAEKVLYDQIYANCIENDPQFNIQSRVNHTRAITVLKAVLFDNPDLFWVEPSIAYSYGNDGYIVAVTLKFYDCARNLDAYKRAFYDCADSVLEQAMKLENDVLKVKYIHDLLTYVNSYQLGAAMNQSAYSAIVNGRTVCAGYAAAFTYYMQRLGIQSFIVEGYAGESHAWNLVKLYGEYYEMDVTWNDPVGNPSNRFYYNYFNITTNEIARTRTRDRLSAASNVPIANGTRYSYPNFFGSSPGSNFSNLNYGNPSVRLPHIYPSAQPQPAAAAPSPPATTPSPPATTPRPTAATPSQPPAATPGSTAQTRPQITIVNNTGYDVYWVYVSATTDDDWGEDRLGDNEILPNGQSVSISLPYPLSTVNRYDILLEDSDNDTYSKFNVLVTANARIVFTFADLD